MFYKTTEDNESGRPGRTAVVATEVSGVVETTIDIMIREQRESCLFYRSFSAEQRLLVTHCSPAVTMSSSSAPASATSRITGSHCSLADVMEEARIDVCDTVGCTWCDEYVVSTDVTLWDGTILFMEVGSFRSRRDIYFVLRNIRYFFPDSSLRIAFTV